MATGVVENAEGKLELEELTLESITRALASGKASKGEYAAVIEEFGGSGKLYFDFLSNPMFAEKEQSTIVQSVTTNLKKVTDRHTKAGTPFPVCKIAKLGDRTLLINMTVHAAQVAAKAAE